MKRVVTAMGVLSTIILLSGCATGSLTERGDAQVTFSTNFVYRKGARIAVLPFFVAGHPDAKVDVAVADKLGMILMQGGFVVVERTLVEFILKEQEMSVSDFVSEQDMKKIASMLNVEFLVFGTLSYRRVQYARTTDYTLESETMKVVDVRTGEVAIAGVADQRDPLRGVSSGLDLTERLGKTLLAKLSK